MRLIRVFVKFVVFFLLIMPLACKLIDPQTESLQPKSNEGCKPTLLFIGSSSIELWNHSKTNIVDSFPDYNVVNKGKSGSDYLYLIDNFSKIMLDFFGDFNRLPNAIIIYSGDNDLVYTDTADRAEDILSRIKKLHAIIQVELSKYHKQISNSTSRLPPIFILSIKPSPSRSHLLKYTIETNKLLQEWVNQLENEPMTLNEISNVHPSPVLFVNIFSEMIVKKEGSVIGELPEVNRELFGNDMLHMNETGYTIWKKVITESISKSLKVDCN